MGGWRGSNGTAVIVQLERLFQHGTTSGSTEAELLERFITRRDEAAFEAIVARHGPMVLGVCRQLLHDPNDVDDAFQATFLVLVRKAGALKRCDLLGNWLYGVAYRVAVRARCLSARRAARAAAAIAAARSGANPRAGLEAGIRRHSSLEQLEAEPWLHQEIARLPEKYRIPIVLCYLEGLSHDDAARRLQWPLGTVKGRLARAKDLLRKRLTRRGFTVSDATFATVLSAPDPNAVVPPVLIQATLRAATSISSGARFSLAASSTISLPVATLGEGVLQAMNIAQVKAFALPLCLAGAVAAGVVAFGAQGNPQEKKGGSRAQPRQKLVDRRNAPQPKPAPHPSARSTDQLLRDQLSADQELYESLVVPGRSFSEDDFRGLVRWSLRLLDASRSISSDPSTRKAAYTAHRDRMKSLNTLAAKSAASGGIKAMTEAQLKEAAELLESLPDEVRRTDFTAPGRAGAAVAGAQPGVPSGGSGSAVGVAALADRQSQALQAQQAQGHPETPRGMMGMMGGMTPGGGGMGGMGAMAGAMGQSQRQLRAIRLREGIAASAAELALKNTDPRNRMIHKKLDEHVSMSFANPTPLGDILKYIKQASTSPTFSGIPIYVDPKGLEETNTTITSTVVIDLEGVPLKTTLRLALKQLGLAYCVRDGVLIISSVQGISEELAEERGELEAANPPAGGVQ